MKNKPYQINPIDLNPRKAVGINLPLNGEGVFKPNYQTKDSIKTSLINYLLTNPGERYGNPNFGLGLRKFIFEQNEGLTLGLIQDEVTSKILTQFPGISVDKMTIEADEDNLSIKIVVEYSIKEFRIEDKIELNFT